MLTPTRWQIMQALWEKEQEGDKEISARDVARLLHDEIEIAEREIGALVDGGLLREGDLTTDRMLFAAFSEEGREKMRARVEREAGE
ncbi:MAG: hypothetical protein ACE5R4_17425 [Armatimonadota bacterium]